MKSGVMAATCQSFHALMARAIDYAGMYPPAGLPLGEAWANYLAYRRSPDAWMLGHFVVPLAELSRLAELAARSDLTGEVSLAVVVPPAVTASESLAQLRQLPPPRGPLAVAVIETKLPADIMTANRRNATCQFALDAAEHASGATLFFEGPAGAEEHIAGLASATKDRQLAIGYKLRTGGLESAAFPSLRDVAATIDACRRHNLAWKATAGLHHPLRQFREEVAAPMHGFVNVLTAAVLAGAHCLPVEAIARILADETPDDFSFTVERLAWGGFVASAEQIQSARRSAMFSFGSCSFDEPRDELRQLGWLAP